MDPGEINAMRKASKEADFEVWEENWEAVCIFLRCHTQWRVSVSGLVGLDYSAVQWVTKLFAVEDPLTMLEKIQVIETAVLRIFRQRG